MRILISAFMLVWSVLAASAQTGQPNAESEFGVATMSCKLWFFKSVPGPSLPVDTLQQCRTEKAELEISIAQIKKEMGELRTGSEFWNDDWINPWRDEHSRLSEELSGKSAWLKVVCTKLEKAEKAATEVCPPPDPAPAGHADKVKKAGANFKNAKDMAAKDLAGARDFIGKAKARAEKIKVAAEQLNKKFAAEAAKKERDEAAGVGSTVQPVIDTVSAQTTVTMPDGGTTMLGGLRFFAGADISPGTDDGDFSSNPGNQSIDFDADTGFGVRGGAVLPLGPNVAVGVGGRYVHSANDTVRLNNPNGTFVNTTGDADIESLLAEVMLLVALPGNVTGRVSAYAGRADRNIDLRIGGATALNFKDTVSATGFGVGLGVPATLFGLPLNNVCFNGSVDFMQFGSANGLTPAGAPIRLGGFDTTTFRIGTTITFDLASITDTQASLTPAYTNPLCP